MPLTGKWKLTSKKFVQYRRNKVALVLPIDNKDPFTQRRYAGKKNETKPEKHINNMINSITNKTVNGTETWAKCQQWQQRRRHKKMLRSFFTWWKSMRTWPSKEIYIHFEYIIVSSWTEMHGDQRKITQNTEKWTNVGCCLRQNQWAMSKLEHKNKRRRKTHI